MRGFVCVILVRGISSLNAWLRGFFWHFHNFPWLCKMFSQTSLHFASHFYSLEVISQPFRSLEIISTTGGGFCRGGGFSQPISQLRNGCMALQSGTCVPKGGFATTKHPSKWGRGCEISAYALRVHLQTAITSSFQLQFAHRLKCWNPDFPSFETMYSIHNLSSSK